MKVKKVAVAIINNLPVNKNMRLEILNNFQLESSVLYLVQSNGLEHFDIMEVIQTDERIEHDN